MKPIQFLLLAILGGGLAYYMLRLRTRVSDRLLICSLAAAAAVGILLPDLAIWAAHAVGVARGVDLVMYLTLFMLSYLIVLLSTKERQTKQKITRLVRALALENAVTSERQRKAA